MDLNEYQKATRRTWNSELHAEEQGKNAAFGVASESGELANKLRKVWYQGHLLDKDAVKEELGDILYYVARVADYIGVTLSDVAESNIEKLWIRYPEGFNPDASRNREEQDD